MAHPIPNSDLLIAGILRRAAGMPDPLGWLTSQHSAAYDAVMAGDEFVMTTSDEGGSNTAERGMNATTMLQLYEAALQAYEAASDSAATSGSIRHADFSSIPCILG